MRLIIICCCTFLHQVLFSSCYSVKIDRLLRRGFLRGSQTESALKSIQNNKSNESFTSNETNVKELNDSYHNAINRVDGQTLKQINVVDNANNTSLNISTLFDIKNYITRESSLKLQFLAYKLKHKINPSLDLHAIVKNTTNIYVAKLEKYFNFISDQPAEFEIDKEFIYLDIIESINQIFKNECISLSNYILSQTNRSVSQDVLKQLAMEMTDMATLEKKEGLMYICEGVNICRSFPAFSDQVAGLLSYVLQMPDDKLLVLLKSLKKVVEVKIGFFRSIMDDDLEFKVSSIVKPMMEDVSEGAKLFLILKGYLTKHFEIFNRNDKESILKIKAVRILISIVDKAFESLGDEIIEFYINNTINGIREWTRGKRQDLHVILTDFCNHLFDVLRYHLEEHTKQEVKVLIEIIVTGTTGNIIIREDLFTNGPKTLKYHSELLALNDII